MERLKTTTKKERFNFLAQTKLTQAVKDYAAKNGMVDEQGNYNKTEAIHGLFEKLKQDSDQTARCLGELARLRTQPPTICDAIGNSVCTICKLKGSPQCPRK